MHYLGFTSKNPHKYLGSGIYWKRHCKKYNYKIADIKTYILHETGNKKDIEIFGEYYSNLFNIIERDDWANLTKEQGQGNSFWLGKKRPGIWNKWIGENHWTKNQDVKNKIANSTRGKIHSEKTRKKISENNKGKIRSSEIKEILSISKLGNKNPSFGKYRGESYTAKKVIDIETERVFNSYLDAADYYNVHYTTISRWIKKEKKLKLI